MTTFARSVGGALAYSRMSYPTFQPPDDPGAFAPDGRDSSARGWSLVIDELLRIRTLEDDWDGEGTEAPGAALVDGAITLAQSLQARGVMPPDRVHASVNATVNFEWHTSLGYTEIEVVSPVEAERRSVRKGSMTTDVVKLVHW